MENQNQKPEVKDAMINYNWKKINSFKGQVITDSMNNDINLL